jgi:hypothetical protein
MLMPDDKIFSLTELQKQILASESIKQIPWGSLRKPPDYSNSIFENGALERGQGAIAYGPSGCGKSTLAFQASGCWAAGMAGMHIMPVKPLRIAALQTEDSLNDLRKYCEGIFAQRIFTPEKIALIEKNFLIMEPVPGGDPEYLKKLLDDVATGYQPDLILLNPLLAFCTADYTRELGALLYQVIDPVIKKHGIGFLGVHHTTKPRDTSAYKAHEHQYLAAGDARIANWPRLSIQLEPVAINPVLVARLRIAKRWQCIPWLNEKGEPTNERYIKHSSGLIWWEDASQEEADSAREDEAPRKILDILPAPSEQGVIRDELRVRAKNKLNIGKDKADAWLNIMLFDGLVERYEFQTEGKGKGRGKGKGKPKRKVALFRRAYE